MIWLILFLISLTMNILLLWGIRNLFKKQDIYEENYLDTRNKLRALYNNLKDIDDRGVFEKDDEVGVTFDGIKSLVEKYGKL